jgi:hypothetical protein
MKKIFGALTVVCSLVVTGCSLFGPVETVRKEPSRTVYRAEGDIPSGEVDATPEYEKVPGESRSSGPR